MEFALTDNQRSIDQAVRRVCARFDDAYWLEHDRTGEFPSEFRQAMVEGGWLGIAMPEQYGGAGLGITEAAVLMHAVANSGGAMSAASTFHINIFGPHPIVVFGNDNQRQRWLPPLIEGRETACFAVTEPDAGLDTGNLRTEARLEGAHYVVEGRKVWTSTAQVADKLMLLARTTPRTSDVSSVDGLTLFYTDLDRERIQVREIDKMGRKAVDSNELFIDGLMVPIEDRIGEEGKGFRYLLDGLNPERILIAAEAIGIGRNALDRAKRYAKERVVFGRPIGQNQAIQHPLARSWVELEAGWLLVLRAAWTYDQGLACGADANAAKYFAAEAAFKACERALMTHGGMGYAREFQVERLLREVLIPRIAPVSQELVLCYLAERVLELPRSY
ncbi:MAG: acyl-CoA dehydrogenase family protein [Arenicellales bacterium]|jgi:acyl-CoA dehydrogenase|nr:acyl-CoA dehydrogenase [Acidiferrobacteraceae bacterium]MDP6312983.1 acyl-CoA dehydrogenase family protein [Arenicellales bacterium]HCV20170.1 acyl-CoA dehydrogenase [Gammaproteobacteria bacterium]MDP7119498.1 acyl-CoA dehydrogenase family protein [Arenicellales bacterium]MDP7193636.1 acyl-CoA dehydrogenase family protein [Arenicellales bacterium]|tara:strand:+ start:1320 stop:2486 length:1167 start_codon:yes stop_codon:yes gene_type:complete